MVMRKMHPEEFFTKEEKDQIVNAIREAERQTSGEIRVYLERKGKGDVMDRAQKVFEKLGMTKTRDRNGVLIYFSLTGHFFAILGDQGIHEKVGEDFWKGIVSAMQDSFLGNDFGGGLVAGILRIGEKLKSNFPRRAGDINELPDEVQG